MQVSPFNDFQPYGKIYSKVITSILKINSFKKNKIKEISAQNNTCKLSYSITNPKTRKNTEKD